MRKCRMDGLLLVAHVTDDAPALRARLVAYRHRGFETLGNETRNETLRRRPAWDDGPRDRSPIICLVSLETRQSLVTLLLGVVVVARSGLSIGSGCPAMVFSFDLVRSDVSDAC